jgi:hypothetical protein
MGCPAERQVFPLTAGRNRGGLVAALMPARCVTGRL